VNGSARHWRGCAKACSGGHKGVLPNADGPRLKLLTSHTQASWALRAGALVFLATAHLATVLQFKTCDRRQCSDQSSSPNLAVRGRRRVE
jgi:hypothetical protein